MVLQIVSNVPHEQGKSEEVMPALMDWRPSGFV
jgi:hypothetical protein